MWAAARPRAASAEEPLALGWPLQRGAARPRAASAETEPLALGQPLQRLSREWSELVPPHWCLTVCSGGLFVVLSYHISLHQGSAFP